MPQCPSAPAPQRKQAHIDADVVQTVEKKDHTQQKQNMVVARDHALVAQINERHQMDAQSFLDVASVTCGDGVTEGFCAENRETDDNADNKNRRRGQLANGELGPLS